jgi:hypothetical protein
MINQGAHGNNPINVEQNPIDVQDSYDDSGSDNKVS